MSRIPRQSSLPLATESRTTKRGAAQDEHLAGVIERVTFHSEDTGFCVLRVKIESRRELATLVGRSAFVAPGERVEADGQWTVDPTHGSQFHAASLRLSSPATPEGVERYLASGLVKGIGPALAKRLVAAFGTDVLDIIENAPEKLRTVPGVGSVRVGRMTEAWADQKHVRDVMVFLHSHGVGTARAVRIHRTYGQDAVAIIRADPFRLARDIVGIGFATADALADRLGTEKTAPSRLRAGLRHILGEARSSGHCGLPQDELLERTEQLLGIDRSLVLATLEAEIRAGDVSRDEVDDRTCIFLSDLYDMERDAATRLRALAEGPLPWPEIDPDSALPWVEEQLEIELAPSQNEALRRALCSKTLVITGGPGVGKTTLLRAILEILGAKDVRTVLAAPTGRAAKRMSEATGRDASTLHRLLESSPRMGGFKRNEDNPLDCDAIIVDESSMLDIPLLAALLRATPPSASLLLIGDVDQLPSVGPGQVLADIMASGALPVVRLHEIFRQAEQSGIVRGAHRVNQGELPTFDASPDSDFFFIEAREPDAIAERLITVVRERIPARFGLDPVRDVQVLCPMRRGRLGSQSLCAELQIALNPPSRAAEKVERFGLTFAPGDKVMQIVNDYERDVFNGDVGFVGSLDPIERELVVEFAGRNVTYPFDHLDGLTLAYATTVHKSQGSEYPAVVIPLTTQHYPMLQRNLVYTAITRARRLVVLIGQRRALAIAVKQGGAVRRWSKLGDWLRGERIR